jgi:hypothetical protein
MTCPLAFCAGRIEGLIGGCLSKDDVAEMTDPDCEFQCPLCCRKTGRKFDVSSRLSRCNSIDTWDAIQWSSAIEVTNSMDIRRFSLPLLVVHLAFGRAESAPAAAIIDNLFKLDFAYVSDHVPTLSTFISLLVDLLVQLCVVYMPMSRASPARVRLEPALEFLAKYPDADIVFVVHAHADVANGNVIFAKGDAGFLSESIDKVRCLLLSIPSFSHLVLDSRTLSRGKFSRLDSQVQLFLPSQRLGYAYLWRCND